MVGNDGSVPFQVMTSVGLSGKTRITWVSRPRSFANCCKKVTHGSGKVMGGS